VLGENKEAKPLGKPHRRAPCGSAWRGTEAEPFGEQSRDPGAHTEGVLRLDVGRKPRPASAFFSYRPEGRTDLGKGRMLRILSSCAPRFLLPTSIGTQRTSLLRSSLRSRNSPFHWRHAEKQPTWNIAAKKRVGERKWISTTPLLTYLRHS
jgi:hypothetical protein